MRTSSYLRIGKLQGGRRRGARCIASFSATLRSCKRSGRSACLACAHQSKISFPVPRQISDLLSNQGDKWCTQFGLSPCKTDRMLRQLRLLFVTLARFFRSRRDLILENVALRQQLAVLRRRSEEHTSEL